jgi:hypothetical protein
MMKKIRKIIGKKKEQVIKKFRLSGKHLFLTYAQIEIERESALKQLRNKLEPRKIMKYVISTETHKEKGKHIHVYIELDNLCDIEARNRLDLMDNEGNIKHGNYQTCRSYNAVISYVVKEGKEQVLTNMDLDDNGRLKNV